MVKASSCQAVGCAALAGICLMVDLKAVSPWAAL